MHKEVVDQWEQDKTLAISAVCGVAFQYGVPPKAVIDALERCVDKPDELAAIGQTILSTGKYRLCKFEKAAADLKYVKYVMERDTFTSVEMNYLRGYFLEKFHLVPNKRSKTAKTVVPNVTPRPEIRLKVVEVAGKVLE